MKNRTEFRTIFIVFCFLIKMLEEVDLDGKFYGCCICAVSYAISVFKKQVK